MKGNGLDRSQVYLDIMADIRVDLIPRHSPGTIGLACSMTHSHRPLASIRILCGGRSAFRPRPRLVGDSVSGPTAPLRQERT